MLSDTASRIPDRSVDADTTLATLANGVRVIALPLAHLQTASVSVFVRSGSAHESRRLNGISHVVEHMVFKGTQRRSGHRWNLDAERLGAEVNAHTDKDHTAFHMRGLAADAPAFVAMLGELLQEPTFPEDELERERQVLLQEEAEIDDDPMAAAYRQFDHACYGVHPMARPVIGSRANIEHVTRADLVRWVQSQYSGVNLIVAAAGGLDGQAIVRAAEAAFAGLPAGVPNRVPVPRYIGGIRLRRVPGSNQTHVVLGCEIPPLSAADPTAEVAAVLFGEGMSSPLLAELRERRGLVYHAACAADLFDLCGQFVIEAAVAPDKLDELLRALAALLQQQAEAIAPEDMERARRQMAVRRLSLLEQPARRIELAALDWLALGRVPSDAERQAAVEGVTAEQVRAFFARMQGERLALALTGSVGPGAVERAGAALGRNAAGEVAAPIVEVPAPVLRKGSRGGRLQH